MANNNGVIKNNNGTNGENQGQKAEKKGFQKAVDTIQRGWHRFSTSKGGRWAIRGGKVILVGLGLKAAYDQGRKSVEPTMVYVTPVDQDEEPKEEEKEVTEEEAAAE